MAEWPSTKAGVGDLVGQVLVNGMATHYAAQNGNLRWTMDGSDSFFKDYRFGGAVLGVLGAVFGDGTVERLGYDLAASTLHSLAATETIRRQAIAKLQQPQGAPGQIPGAPQAQIPAPGFSAPFPQAQAQAQPQFVQGAFYPGQFR